MLSPGDRQWNLSLMVEANDARSLFSHGLWTVRDMNNDFDHAVSAMSLLALGAEKLLKLTIGLVHVEQHQAWPSRAYMKQAIGHKVQHGDREARQLLDLTRGTAPGWVTELAAGVDGDPVLEAVLQALERFGSEGRFYFLDMLGEHPQTQIAPHMLWQQMTTDVAIANPDLLAKLTTMDVSEGRLGLNAIIARSLEGWWEFYRAVWTTDVIGGQAQQFSSEIRLLDRHTWPQRETATPESGGL